MTLTTLITIYSLIGLCAIFFVLSFLTHFISSTRYTNYIKRTDFNAWDKAVKNIQWVGFASPKFLWRVEPSLIPKDLENKLSKEYDYLRLKATVIKSKKYLLTSFIFFNVVLILGMLAAVIVTKMNV